MDVGQVKDTQQLINRQDRKRSKYVIYIIDSVYNVTYFSYFHTNGSNLRVENENISDSNLQLQFSMVPLPNNLLSIPLLTQACFGAFHMN